VNAIHNNERPLLQRDTQVSLKFTNLSASSPDNLMIHCMYWD
jgi:hypothetical protein